MRTWRKCHGTFVFLILLFLKHLLAFAVHTAVFEQSEGVSAFPGCALFCHKWDALLASAHSSETPAWPSPCFCCKNKHSWVYPEWKPLLPGGNLNEVSRCRIHSIGCCLFCFDLFFLFCQEAIFRPLSPLWVPKQSGMSRSLLWKLYVLTASAPLRWSLEKCVVFLSVSHL